MLTQIRNFSLRGRQFSDILTDSPLMRTVFRFTLIVAHDSLIAYEFHEDFCVGVGHFGGIGRTGVDAAFVVLFLGVEVVGLLLWDLGVEQQVQFLVDAAEFLVFPHQIDHEDA